MNENLFSYGTLQKEKVQMELFGRTLQGTKDAVAGYKISTIEIRDESVVSKSEQTLHLIAVASTPDNKIDGMVLELTPQELETADAYELKTTRELRLHLNLANRPGSTWLLDNRSRDSRRCVPHRLTSVCTFKCTKSRRRRGALRLRSGLRRRYQKPSMS